MIEEASRSSVAVSRGRPVWKRITPSRSWFAPTTITSPSTSRAVARTEPKSDAWAASIGNRASRSGFRETLTRVRNRKGRASGYRTFQHRSLGGDRAPVLRGGRRPAARLRTDREHAGHARRRAAVGAAPARRAGARARSLHRQPGRTAGEGRARGDAREPA